MICENTISAGFQFMLGKFLFDAAIFGVAVGLMALFLLGVYLLTRSKK